MLVRCANCEAEHEVEAPIAPEGAFVHCPSCAALTPHAPAPALPAQNSDFSEVHLGDTPPLVRRPGRALDERDTSTPKPAKRPRRKKKKPRAPRRERVSLAEQGAVAAQRVKAEKEESEDGPSIVVDIGQFGTAPPEAPEVLVPDPQAAFAPLSTPAPTVGGPARHRVRQATTADLKVEVVEHVETVRPPRLWLFTLVLLVLVVGAFGVFVGWKNNWGPIWEDPEAAVVQAFGPAPAAALAQAPNPEIIAEAPSGQILVRDVTLAWTGARGDVAVVSGVVKNATNRSQRAISLEVDLVEGQRAVHVKRRVVACCTPLSGPDALKIANDPKHVHFDDRLKGAVTLAPGDERPFTTLLQGAGIKAPGRRITAQVVVKFSEPVSPTL